MEFVIQLNDGKEKNRISSFSLFRFKLKLRIRFKNRKTILREQKNDDEI